MKTIQNKQKPVVKRQRKKAECAKCSRTLNSYASSEDFHLICAGCFAADDLSRLKPEHQKFVNNIASGQNQTQAYLQAYPNASYETAMVNGSNLLRNTKIADAVRQRIRHALANSEVTPEEVIGSAASQMRSSIDDVLDDNGSFSLEKARKTGAVHLIKKMEITERPIMGTNKMEKTYKIEMLTNQDARREVSNYIGLEKQPAANPPSPTLEDEIRHVFAALVARFVTDELKQQERDLMIGEILKSFERKYGAEAVKLLTDGLQ